MGVLRVGVWILFAVGGVVLPLCGVGLWGLDLGSVLFLFGIGLLDCDIFTSPFRISPSSTTPSFFRFPLFSLFASAYICHSLLHAPLL